MAYYRGSVNVTNALFQSFASISSQSLSAIVFFERDMAKRWCSDQIRFREYHAFKILQKPSKDSVCEAAERVVASSFSSP